MSCILQTWNDRKNGKVTRGLMDQILERRDIILVAAGSLGCVRSIYLYIAKRKQLSQFVPCVISPTEYALGRNTEKIKPYLQRAIDGENVSGIVIYMSCVECLSGTDYAMLADQLDNPSNIPIIPIFRGPLSGHLSVNTEELLSQIPNTGLQASVTCSLPVASPDYDGINSAAEMWGVNRFVITGGGCVSCMSPVHDTERLYWCRMNDTAVSLGIEQVLAGKLQSLYADAERSTILFGTPVSTFTVTNMDVLTGEIAIDARTTGWKPADMAVSNFLVCMIQKYSLQLLHNAPVDEKTITLMGCSYLSSGMPGKFAEMMKQLEDRGWKIKIWSPFLRKKPDLHWVVSAQGLAAAELMKKELNIPYIAGVPVGSVQLENLIRKITEKEVIIPTVSEKQKKKGEVVVLGEPLLTKAISEYICFVRPDLSVKKVILCSGPSEKTFWQSQGFLDEWIFSEDTSEWMELCRNAGAVIADPLLLEIANVKKGFPLPYPMVSGMMFSDCVRSVFGSLGDQELTSFLSDIPAKAASAI